MNRKQFDIMLSSKHCPLLKTLTEATRHTLEQTDNISSRANQRLGMHVALTMAGTCSTIAVICLLLDKHPAIGLLFMISGSAGLFCFAISVGLWITSILNSINEKFLQDIGQVHAAVLYCLQYATNIPDEFFKLIWKNEVSVKQLLEIALQSLAKEITEIDSCLSNTSFRNINTEVIEHKRTLTKKHLHQLYDGGRGLNIKLKKHIRLYYPEQKKQTA